MFSGRYVVTGGCGFIGSHLCAHLMELGADVTVIDDLSRGKRENLAGGPAESAAVEEFDIRHVDRLERCLKDAKATHVIHLAAIHFIPECEADPTHAISVNVQGTQAVLEACQRARSVASVVVASSGAVYKPSFEAHGEYDSVAPTDVYGHTKLWAEQLASLFNRRTGIPVGVARLFNTFGPGETNPHFIPTVIRQLENGNELALGRLNTRRDYVYVGDVACALQSLSQVAAAGGLLTCNVGREEAIEGKTVVEILGRLTGRDIELRTDLARLRADDRPVLLSDCRVARRELGWQAETGLEEGLEAALRQPIAGGVSFV